MHRFHGNVAGDPAITMASDTTADRQTAGKSDATSAGRPSAAAGPGIELKGGMYAFMSLRIATTDLQRIDALLADKVQQAPGFFSDTPVIVDLTLLEIDDAAREASAGFDTVALIDCIRRHRLMPVVARVGDKSSPLANVIALPLIEGGTRRASVTDGMQDSSSGVPPGDNASSVPDEMRNAPDTVQGDDRSWEQAARPAMVIDKPVRSGQQIYARDTDLIIIGQVGPGAEVIADNNIHIYGPLRGRALCGVSGNTSARIFCQSLEAELVSVAGNFRMLETIPADLRGKPAKIAFDNDKLSIEPL